jgi:hypothetical protein
MKTISTRNATLTGGSGTEIMMAGACDVLVLPANDMLYRSWVSQESRR